MFIDYELSTDEIYGCEPTDNTEYNKGFTGRIKFTYYNEITKKDETSKLDIDNIFDTPTVFDEDAFTEFVNAHAVTFVKETLNEYENLISIYSVEVWNKND